jgi:hypothetical protein
MLKVKHLTSMAKTLLPLPMQKFLVIMLIINVLVSGLLLKVAQTLPLDALATLKERKTKLLMMAVTLKVLIVSPAASGHMPKVK